MHLFSQGRLLDGLYTLLQRDVLVVPLVLVTCSLSLSLVDLGTQPTMAPKKKCILLRKSACASRSI